MSHKVELLPDNPPSVTAEPLAPVELDAREYWERFLPERVRDLKAKGPQALDRAIRAAWWRREYLVALHRTKAPEIHPQVLMDLYREELYPPPETPTSIQGTLPLITT